MAAVLGRVIEKDTSIYAINVRSASIHMCDINPIFNYIFSFVVILFSDYFFVPLTGDRHFLFGVAHIFIPIYISVYI